MLINNMQITCTTRYIEKIFRNHLSIIDIICLSLSMPQWILKKGDSS